jgi:hypothetical protein
MLICLDFGCIYHMRKKTAAQENSIMYTSGKNFVNIVLCKTVKEKHSNKAQQG